MNSINKDVNCLNCGRAVCKEFISNINVTMHPEFRDKIMDESIFNWSCEYCNESSRVIYPFVYQDAKNKFVIYFFPSASDCKLNDHISNTRYPKISDVKKRIVENVNDLKEKIIIFEQGLEDSAIEIIKSAIRKSFDNENLYIYFFRCNSSQKCLEFAVINKKNEVNYKSVKYMAYEKALDFCSNYEYDKERFTIIDSNWAQEILIDSKDINR